MLSTTDIESEFTGLESAHDSGSLHVHRVSGARPVGYRLSSGDFRDLLHLKMGRKNGVDMTRLYEAAGLDFPFGGVFPENPDFDMIKLWRARIAKSESEVIVLQDEESGDYTFVNPVLRGTDAYYDKIRQYAKNLNDWVLASGRDRLVHLTFTLQSFHHYNVLDQFNLLSRLVHNAVQRMEKSRYPRGHRKAGQPRHFGHKIRLFWVAEPHESGFIHIHMLVFEEEIPHWRGVAEWWGKSGYADDIGFDYKVIPVRQYKRLRNGDVEVKFPVIDYVTKYIGKSFPRQDAADSPLGDIAGWWAAFLYFSNKRTWGSSRDISRTMRGLESESGDSGAAEPDAPRACIVKGCFVYRGTAPFADFGVVRDVFNGDWMDYFQTHRIAEFKPPPFEPRVRGYPIMRRSGRSVRWGYNSVPVAVASGGCGGGGDVFEIIRRNHPFAVKRVGGVLRRDFGN